MASRWTSQPCSSGWYALSCPGFTLSSAPPLTPARTLPPGVLQAAAETARQAAEQARAAAAEGAQAAQRTREEVAAQLAEAQAQAADAKAQLADAKAQLELKTKELGEQSREAEAAAANGGTPALPVLDTAR